MPLSSDLLRVLRGWNGGETQTRGREGREGREKENGIRSSSFLYTLFPQLLSLVFTSDTSASIRMLVSQ